MATRDCLVTNILQNIFVCVQQKKETKCKSSNLLCGNGILKCCSKELTCTVNNVVILSSLFNIFIMSDFEQCVVGVYQLKNEKQDRCGI